MVKKFDMKKWDKKFGKNLSTKPPKKFFLNDYTHTTFRRICIR